MATAWDEQPKFADIEDRSTVWAHCTTCNEPITCAQFDDGISVCPACGATGQPMFVRDQVQLDVNWHELRILTIWASNYASKFCNEGSRKCLAGILHRLALQHPEHSDAQPLTLFGEIQQLQRAIDAGELEGIPPQRVQTNVRDLLAEDETT